MLNSVLFDLDGTLLDTVDDFLAIIRDMRAERGLADESLERVRPSVSNGAIGMLSAAFAITPQQPGFEDLREDFLQRYQDAIAVHTRPFPGITELLDWLERPESCEVDDGKGRIRVADISGEENLPTAMIRIDCSKGTYIRALARDLGEALGSGAFLSSLRRTGNGGFDISQSISLDEALALLGHE